jgi:cation:H+ antiporter
MSSEIVTAVLFVSGIALLIVGAEALVRGASHLAIATGVPPLVVGLTIVAFGTSAPELAVSLQASLANQSDMALGNIVGGNIANILLILEVTAIFATPLHIGAGMLWFDTPVMIGASALLLYLSLDGLLSQQDGLILLALLVVYTLLRLLRRRSGDMRPQAIQRLPGRETPFW